MYVDIRKVSGTLLIQLSSMNSRNLRSNQTELPISGTNILPACLERLLTSVAAIDCRDIHVKQPSLVSPSTLSGGGLQFRSTLRTRARMSCRSASKGLAGILAVLLVLLLGSIGAWSASASLSLCSVSSLPIAASAAVGGKRVLRVAREDPGFVLLSPSVAAAAAVVPVVVVFL